MARRIILRFALSAVLSAVLIAGCAASKEDPSGSSAGINTSASTASAYSTASASQPQPVAKPRESAPKNADQHLLRDMADNHEGMILLAHAGMEQRHEHKMDDDPALAADVRQDAAKTEMVSLLRSEYTDPHEPRPSPRDRAVVDSIMRLTGDAYDKAFRDYMVQHGQFGIGMIDRALPQLRNQKVKALAERMRAAHLRGLNTIPQTAARNP